VLKDHRCPIFRVFCERWVTMLPEPPLFCDGAWAPRQNSLWDTTLKPDHLWQRRFYDFVV